jgi:hypothetical protein
MNDQNILKVLITGAAGNLAYSLIPMIGSGNNEFKKRFGIWTKHKTTHIFN